MIQTFTLAKYSKVLYRLNAATKYFVQSEIKALETPIIRLPLEMRLAPAGANNVKPNASKLLLSREQNKGRYKFITGIQETKFSGWYVGNDYEYHRGAKVLSLIIFHFSEDQTSLEVFYFHRYDKNNTSLRIRFANEVIPAFQKGGD